MFTLDILNWLLLDRLLLTQFAVFLMLQLGAIPRSMSPNARFTCYMFGTGVFAITYVFQLVEISLGFAFGLFAIFSMLRYRTDLLSIREMTYLFLVVVMALLGAVSPLSLLELLLVLTLIVGAAVLSERRVIAIQPSVLQVRYEQIALIQSPLRDALLADLQQRTGLKIIDVKVDSIDFVQDSAMLSLWYLGTEQEAGQS